MHSPINLTVNYDGGVRGGQAASAWTVTGNGLLFESRVLAEGGVTLGTGITVTEAELTAQEEGVKAALALIQRGFVTWSEDGWVL